MAFREADFMSREQIAKRLMEMAARRSVETQFGWAHPDCDVLQEAARALTGASLPAEYPGAVLSTCTAYVTPEH
jgi:hypothetical protein